MISYSNLLLYLACLFVFWQRMIKKWHLWCLNYHFITFPLALKESQEEKISLFVVSLTLYLESRRFDPNLASMYKLVLLMNFIQGFSFLILLFVLRVHSSSFRFTRGKSLLGLWVTTFLPNWQPLLIFVRFTSNVLCMCSNRGKSLLGLWVTNFLNASQLTATLNLRQIYLNILLHVLQ